MTRFMLNVVEISLSMAAVIAVVLILAQIVGRKFTAKSRYIIWLIVLVRLAVPFNTGLFPSLFEFDFSGEAEAPEMTQIFESTAYNNAEYYAPEGFTWDNSIQAVSEVDYAYSEDIRLAEKVTEAASEAESSADINFSYDVILKALTCVYISGAVIFFMWKIVAYLAYTEMIMRSRLDVSDEVYDVYNRICNDMNITKKPEIYVSSYIKSPLLYGFFKPCVVLSDELTDTSSLSAVLAHELTHYVRRDLWLKLISLIAVSLHWFNPLVHISAKKFEFEMELSCDESVLKDFDDEHRVAYGIVVLDIVKRCEKASGNLTTHFNTGSSVLKRRIVNIIDTSEKRKGRIMMISVLVICIFAGSAFAFRIGSGKSGGEKIEVFDTETTETESDNLESESESSAPAYSTGVTITSLDDWEKISPNNQYSENCYNFFWNLLSGESEIPEYNSVIINDWSITCESFSPDNYELIFDFTVESSSLDTLPVGTYHKRVRDIVDCIMDDFDELAPAYEFDDMEEVQMLRTWIRSRYIWDCPTYGEYNSYDIIADYICTYYHDTVYGVQIDKFIELAEEKFGVRNSDLSDIEGRINEVDGERYVQAGGMGGGTSYTVTGCDKADDITTVTVQFYADCNKLLKSYKVEYKFKDTGIWLGYKMIEGSLYEPYGLRQYFAGNYDVILYDTSDNENDIYENYQEFITALLEAREYAPYGTGDGYSTAFSETMKNVKFGDYTVTQEEYNGDMTVILDIEVVESDVELFPAGKNSYRISDGYIPMNIVPLDKYISGYNFADTAAQNALNLWFGTCAGYLLPRFGELPTGDYTTYKLNESMTESSYMSDIGEYILFTYSDGNGLSDQEMQYYAQKCFGVDYTPSGTVYEENGIYTVGGHGGERWSMTALGEVWENNEITVTIQFYADYSKLVKSHLTEYNFTLLDDGTLVFNGSEIIKKASVIPAHYGV